MLAQWWSHHFWVASLVGWYLNPLSSLANAQSLTNVSISNTSPEIDYTPFLCNSSVASCDGAWSVITQDDGSTVVSTSGEGGTNVIPQMFLLFRATELTLTTGPSSNASMNVTVSAGRVQISRVVDSRSRIMSIVDLNEDETTLLSITYLDSSTPTRLDIGNITLVVPNNSSSTSFLPTPTLPPSIMIPSFTPPSTTSSPSPADTAAASAKAAHRKIVVLAVSLTVGLGLGLTLICSTIFYIWRRRRRKRMENSGPPGPYEASWFN